MGSLLFAAAVLAAAGSAPAQFAASPAFPSIALPPALDRVLEEYERAWREHDPVALSELFSEDGFVLADGKPPVRGRAAIRAAYAGSGGPFHLRALAYAREGQVGYIVGGFGRAPGEADTGKFILTLRQGSGGRWEITAEMDNSNRRTWPAPAPTATALSGQ